MFNVSNLIISTSLNNQPRMNRPTLIDLNPNEHNQGLCYYPLMTNLDSFIGSCSVFDNLLSRI